MVSKRNEIWTGYAVRFAVVLQWVAGASMMVLLIYGLSTVYALSLSGFVLMFTTFSLGIAIGLLWAKHRNVKDFRQAINDVLGLTIVVAFAIVLATFALLNWLDTIPIAIGYITFSLLAIATGFCGGASISFAVLYFASQKQIAKNIKYRSLFGLGLLGSAIGTVLFSAIIVPVFGIMNGALVVVIILSMAILLIGTTSQRKMKS